MSKTIKVYDKLDEKVVTIPEREVERVKEMKHVFQAIELLFGGRKVEKSPFVSGLLKFLTVYMMERCLPDKKIMQKHIAINQTIFEAVGKAWKSEYDKVAIEKFKKPFDQLADADRNTIGDEYDYVFDLVTFSLITFAFNSWTPKFYRVDDVSKKLMGRKGSDFISNVEYAKALIKELEDNLRYVVETPATELEDGLLKPPT